MITTRDRDGQARNQNHPKNAREPSRTSKRHWHGPGRRARAGKALRDAGRRCNAVVDVKNRCPSVTAEDFKIDPVDAARTQLTRVIEPSRPRARLEGRVGSSSVRLPVRLAHCQACVVLPGVRRHRCSPGSPGATVGRLHMHAPRRQEYGKLSYADPDGSAVHVGKRPVDATSEVRQVKTGPVSSVGRASPW